MSVLGTKSTNTFNFGLIGDVALPFLVGNLFLAMKTILALMTFLIDVVCYKY